MYRLSKPQEAIHYMSSFSNDSIGNIAGDVFYNFPVDLDKMREAILNFLDKCEVMHTRIIKNNGLVMQYIKKDYSYDNIPVLKFNTYDEYVDWAQKEAQIPIDINGKLFRIFLIDINGKIGLYGVVHHIISDASSFAYIGKYVGRYLKGEKDIIIYPYKEYLETEEVYENSVRYQKDKKYWLNEMASYKVNYYCNKHTTKIGTKRKSLIIDQQTSYNLKNFCEKNNITEYVFLFSILATLYTKTTQKKEFFIGTPVLNRFNTHEENMVGVFVNTIPIGFNLDDETSFLEICSHTSDKILSAFRHQKYHYTQLLKDSSNQNRADERLFDVLFSFWNVKILEDSTADWFSCCSQVESLQLHVDDRKNEGCYLINYDYQTEKFNESDIKLIHNRILGLIEQTLSTPDKPIKEITIISDSEKQKLLKDFNNTEHKYNISDNETLYSLFEKVAENNSEKVCIRASGEEITFGDFKNKVEALDCRIREITNSKKSIIAVICERSFEMYSAIYGIIRGGNAYLPIDPDYPKERIEYILENSNAALVVAQNKFTHLAGDLPCINMTELINSPTEEFGLFPPAAIEDDTAYVIYTSGSTGNPKGAKVSHKSAVNRILWMHDKYPLLENDVILQKTPYTFDVSVWEHFWWGITGSALSVSKPGEHFLPAKILEEVFSNKITHLHFVPSVFELFLNYLEAHKDECSKFYSVKYVFLSGEALTANLVKRFYALFDYNKVTLHNLYGPTECAVDVTYYDCSPTDTDPVPIGKPIYNTQMYVVDKFMNPVPLGVTGELCIAGVNVGQGYLNNPELTAEKFVDNPFGSGKLYKTGDLAYWREDGNIIFVGRNDFQVKINGQRIELGEIESAVTNIDGVIQSAVVVRKDNDDRQFICAFYTGEELDSKELRSVLSSKLPKYMLPHIFCFLNELPLTSSGKINRNVLPEVDFTSVSADTDFEIPETAEEKALADVVCSVLRINDVNMLDNFFNIGGDSIKAIYVVSELEEIGYELHVADVMQSDTLSDVAKAMKATSNKVKYEQNEVNGFIPFTPIMRAFLSENNTIPTDFVHTCIISTDCDENVAKKALDALVSHHDILRGTFADNGIEIHPSNERDVYSFKAITIDDADKAKAFLNKTSLEEDKLVNVVFCKTQNETLLSITIHHFLIDLVSWEVLLKDFKTVANQLMNNVEIALNAKTASFMMWNEELQKYSETMPVEIKEYWENINTTLDNTKRISSDEENEAEHYTYTFDKFVSDKLINEANNTYGTRTNEILLTALGLAAGKIADGSIGLYVETHGRVELHQPIAIENTVGWFTSCYPVVINNNDNITEELINTKETLRNLPNNGIDYLLLSQGFHKNTDIIFNFYNNTPDEDMKNGFIAFNSDVSVFPGKINVNCYITGNILTVEISVPKCKHKKQISEELGLEFVVQIKNLIELCTKSKDVVKTRSDFSDNELTESELEELLNLFDWTDDDE